MVDVPIPQNRSALKRHFDACPAAVQNYFTHLPALLAVFPLDVCIAYAFSQVELAHNMALYCGVVKKHKADGTIARSVIDAHHMSRPEFKDKFKIVFGSTVPPAVLSHLTKAEVIRDKIMHGKQTLEREKREALYNILTYAERLNDEVFRLGGFRPFGVLKGFKGRAKSLDKATTRWMLKGMGFAVS